MEREKERDRERKRGMVFTISSKKEGGKRKGEAMRDGVCLR